MHERLTTLTRSTLLPSKYPRNGPIYISLKSETFAKIVCSWTVPGHDRCILHSASMESPFKILQLNDSLQVLYKIDGDARIAEHNCGGAVDDCQDSRDEDALFEKSKSFNGLEKDHKDGNPPSCT